MTDHWNSQRRAVLVASQEMARLGLVAGSSGNISSRLPGADGRELLAITPMGRAYGTISDKDIVVADFDLEPVEGEGTPSSESLLHVAIYKARPDIRAVIHTHSVYSTIAAVAGMEIPPIVDEMVIALGGTVHVSDYAPPASQELADNVCAALGDQSAVLIRNHGVVGVGSGLSEALNVCILVERIAQIFIYSSILGKVSTLPTDMVEAELGIYRMMRQSAL